MPVEREGAYHGRMHVALTDVLTCPRCGPGHGLILLPEEVRERRVVSGFLGCADCRERYAVEGGVAGLAVDAPVEMAESERSEEGAVRLAGLLGLAGVQGVVLLAGPAAAEGEALSELLEGVEVVATTSPGAGVSAMEVGGTLPFQSGTLRGIALTGGAADRLLEEGARALAPVGRLLLDPAPSDGRSRVEAAGLRVVAEQAGVLVAGR